MNALHGSCPAAALEVRQISDHEWRVGDRRKAEESPQKVLGYIQKRGATFEVFAMNARGPDPVFECWEAAIASFASRENEVQKGTVNGHSLVPVVGK